MPPTLCVSAELPNLAVIRCFVEDIAIEFQMDRDVVIDMIQAVDEAATNTIVHGYHGQPGDIEIEATREQDTLVVRLRDHAFPFDPTLAPPPDLTLPLEMRRFGGLGIHLIRQFTDAMIYRVTSDGSNELTLIKRIR